MLPIIDLSPLRPLTADISVFQEDETKIIAQNFRNALQKYGFLYISGHGIQDDVIGDAFKDAKEFFSLENHSIHNKYYRKKGVMLGYIDGVNERDLPENPMDLKQGFDFVLDCPEFRTMSEHQQKSLRCLYEQFQVLSLFIQRFLAVCLEMEDIEYFVKAHQKVGDITENSTTMRILHYKAITGTVLEQQSRMSTHTDFGTFTMLLQDDVGGLQVLSPCEKKYVDAVPIKNTLVFNVGDLLQAWSHHKLKSTLHQVVIPQEMIRLHKSRQSIVFFTNPDNDYVFSGIDKNGNFEKKSVREHIEERNNTTIFDVDHESEY